MCKAIENKKDFVESSLESDVAAKILRLFYTWRATYDEIHLQEGIRLTNTIKNKNLKRELTALLVEYEEFKDFAWKQSSEESGDSDYEKLLKMLWNLNQLKKSGFIEDYLNDARDIVFKMDDKELKRSCFSLLSFLYSFNEVHQAVHLYSKNDD